MDDPTHPECLYRTDTVGWIPNRVLIEKSGADHSVYETVSERFARRLLADNDFHYEARRRFRPSPEDDPQSFPR